MKKLPLKPLLLPASAAHKSGVVSFLKNGNAKIILGGGKTAVVPRSRQYDLTQATIFGLNERLTLSANSPIIGNNQSLRDAFNKEWKKYNKALAEKKSGPLNYGVYAYYEEKNELARFCQPRWHKIVAVASSSKLISDPKDKLSWDQIRRVFQNTTIALAGCSVGGSIIHAAVMDMRPDNIKIADKSLYKMENINRVRLGYSEIVRPEGARKNSTDLLLRNKALVTAAQIYAIDPYVNIFIYPDGINDFNIGRFLKGSGPEPAADIVVEEVDDPRIKILLRERARKLGIPLIMATDIGSCVQLDIARFDQNRKLPMTYGASDKALKQSMLAVYANPGDRKIFFQFVDKLIGTDYRRDELKKIIDGKTEIPTSTIIPQLGSTISVAGGIMAETIARIRLGWHYPRRLVFNKRSFRVKAYG